MGHLGSMYNFTSNFIFQEQNGLAELESLCLACGSLAGVPRPDRFLNRFVNNKGVYVTVWYVAPLAIVQRF